MSKKFLVSAICSLGILQVSTDLAAQPASLDPSQSARVSQLARAGDCQKIMAQIVESEKQIAFIEASDEVSGSGGHPQTVRAIWMNSRWLAINSGIMLLNAKGCPMPSRIPEPSDFIEAARECAHLRSNRRKSDPRCDQSQWRRSPQ